MAHSCPECGCTCHCGGDIDDICFGEAEGYCSCCDDEQDDEDVIGQCDECGGCYGTHFSECPNAITANNLRKEGFD